MSYVQQPLVVDVPLYLDFVLPTSGVLYRLFANLMS